MAHVISVIKPAVWIVYVVIVFEILFMISPFAIHFHLAPGIGAAMDSLAGNRFVTLNVADGPGWRLSAAGADIEIAASHRYGTTAPGQPSLQILLRATCPGEATVIWTLERHSD